MVCELNTYKPSTKDLNKHYSTPSAPAFSFPISLLCGKLQQSLLYLNHYAKTMKSLLRKDP